MFVFLRMGKPDPVKHSLWKVVRLVFFTCFVADSRAVDAMINISYAATPMTHHFDSAPRSRRDHDEGQRMGLKNGAFLEIVRFLFNNFYLFYRLLFLLVQRDD